MGSDTPKWIFHRWGGIHPPRGSHKKNMPWGIGLNTLNIELSFIEIEKMSNLRFKNLVKEKVKSAAFEYLITQLKKQTKILHIQYNIYWEETRIQV